jgi:histidinol-phosphate aminotransferase
LSWVRQEFDKIEPYRPGKRASEVKRELGLDDVIKLSSNESSFPPPEKAARAMGRVIKGLNRYPDGGCRLLRGKLADRLGCPPETIIIGNGSNELLRLLAAALLGPGDEVVMASPSFIVYPLVTKLHGADSIEVPLKGLVHDLDAMVAAVGPRTKLLFVCNPNNPTGTVVSAESVRTFLRAVPDEVVVCFDEAYHEFVEDPGYRTAIEFRDEHPNVIVMRTFSKIYGLAGARVGYGVAAPSIVETIDKIREPFNVNTMAQVGAYYALDCDGEIASRRRANRAERDFLQQGLDALGLERAESQGNFVYFDCGLSAMEAFELLKRQGVIVRAFGKSRFIRATLGDRRENARLLAALQSINASR